jgi:ABC-type multidrug transport system ATPase subunit
MNTPKRSGNSGKQAPASRHPKPPTRPRTEATTAAKRAGPPGAIDAFALHKAYGDLAALDTLDLSIPEGQRVALVGHNGSGKTTFMRLCAGLMEPTSGSVRLLGHEAGSIEARAAVSYLADNPSFYDDLSLWEHLEYTAGLHGRDEHWAQEAADLLDAFGLYERADDRPVTFSRGLKQKAAITMGLIRPLQLLLVDEPFVGLDAAGKDALLEVFDEVHGRGVTVVVATHELAFVQRVDRLVALREGALIHDGSPKDIDVVRLVS